MMHENRPSALNFIAEVYAGPILFLRMLLISVTILEGLEECSFLCTIYLETSFQQRWFIYPMKLTLRKSNTFDFLLNENIIVRCHCLDIVWHEQETWKLTLVQ